MSDQNDMLKMLYDNNARLKQTETREVPGAIPGFTSFYATGTFTPFYEGLTTAGAWTYTTQTGFYSRIGNRCFFNLSIVAATRPTPPVGTAVVSHLPFTSVSTANSHSPVSIDSINAITLTGTIIQLTARVPPSATYIEFLEVTGTAPAVVNFLNSTGFTATAIIRISGNYLVA